MAALRQGLDHDYEAAAGLDPTPQGAPPAPKFRATLGLDPFGRLDMPSNRPKLTLFWSYLFWFVGVVLVVVGALGVCGSLFGISSGQKLFFMLLAMGSIGVIGKTLVMLGRRLAIKASIFSLANDSRPPVLYLRSFKMDRKLARSVTHPAGRLWFGLTRLATEEEQLIEVLSVIGPVIAIGKPRESLPTLGAKRIYVNDDDWQQRIIAFMRQARLVVIVYGGTTPGLKWEIDTARALLRPEQILYALTAEDFQKMWKDRPRPDSKTGLIAGFQYPSSNGASLLLPLANSHWICTNLIKPKVSSFKHTLQPVFSTLSIAWRPPRPSLLNPLVGLLAILFAGFPLSFAVLFVNFALFGDYYVLLPEPLPGVETIERAGGDIFVKVELPKGVSIELPRSWVVLSKSQRITLDEWVKSRLGDLYRSGVSELPFAASYYANRQNTIGIVNIRYYPDLDVSQDDSFVASRGDIRQLDDALKAGMLEEMGAVGASLSSWSGTRKVYINGITAFVTEYRRSSLQDGDFRVRLVRVLAGERSFTLTVSYLEARSSALEPMCDRIISSLTLSGVSRS